MAFVIDDVAAVAAEATAETSAATVEEVGSTSIEFAGSAAQDVEVIGDGIGESSLHIEEGINEEINLGNIKPCDSHLSAFIIYKLYFI